MKYKFRVWNKDAKKMDYKFMLPWLNFNRRLNDIFADENLVFMRATGHLDKNKKEIWQGDIIKAWSATGELIFGGQSMVVGIVNYYTNPGLVEVIGNEWENPELVQLR
jgi:hypothetical protein